MAEEKSSSSKENRWKKGWNRGNYGGTPGAVYGLGFLGAAIYFVQHATTFGAAVIGVLKAIVWPALLVFKALELLGM